MFVSTHTRSVTTEPGKMPRSSASGFSSANVTALAPIGGSEDARRDTFARRFPHHGPEAHKSGQDAEAAKAEAARQFEAAAALSVTLTSLALSTRPPAETFAEPWSRREAPADTLPTRSGEPSLDDLLVQVLASPAEASSADFNASQPLVPAPSLRRTVG